MNEMSIIYLPEKLFAIMKALPSQQSSGKKFNGWIISNSLRS